MSYIKVQDVLPADLLRRVQKYIDGRHIYIPRKAGSRRSWGARTKAKIFTARRNQCIFRGYRAGLSVKDLAARYFITDKTVYKVIAAIKYKK